MEAMRVASLRRPKSAAAWGLDDEDEFLANDPVGVATDSMGVAVETGAVPPNNGGVTSALAGDADEDITMATAACEDSDGGSAGDGECLHT